MVQALPGRAVLRVVTPAALTAAEQQAAAAAAQPSAEVASNLANFIRTEFDLFRRHRDTEAGWSHRLLSAIRTFNGQYDPQKLAQIREFGGSDVYARLIAMKCRGASSLLRDVYLSADRPWDLEPPADPDVPPEVMNAIQQLVMLEVQGMQQAGQPVDVSKIRERTMELVTAARRAAKKQAIERTKLAEDKIEEYLQEGGFERALAEFITDLPLFPFACIKGPVVRIFPTVVWTDGKATTENRPRMTWSRVSPFDLFWTPGVSDIENAAVIERSRVTRADLNDLLDLPGYNHAAIREILELYGRGGLDDNWDLTDSERATQEHREDPRTNRSGLISCLEYHGNVQGRMLREYGMSEKQVPDADRDYMVQAWLIGRYVIKVQLSPSPRRRHPYYITSFEKVPGTVIGNGLPDILDDIQDVANATLRALVNNLSIASGPQVVVNDDRLAPDEDGDQLFPWKRWHTTADPMGGSATVPPVTFFQPNSNAQELLGVYRAFSDLADELSAIPKYLSGNGVGGAGRTASGLAMLMGNASKILQTVAANIDGDVLEPVLTGLHEMVLLTDSSGLLTGEEVIRVKGVVVAIQRETQRARQLEFLQVTANPIDSQITGPKGRAAVLRAVASTIGLDGEKVVPTDGEIDQAMQQQAAQMAQAGAQAQGTQAGPATTGDMGPRENLQKPISGGVQ